MTTGTRISDNRGSAENYYIIQPQGWKTSLGYGPTGSYWEKSWTGSDDPPVAPTYERYTWIRRSDGRRFTAKIRTNYPPAHRLRAEHPYSCSITSTSGNAYTWSHYFFGSVDEDDQRTTWSQWGRGYFVTRDWGANDDLALIGKLREKIAGSDFNMGVFLGEGRESLKLITETATKIYKSLNQFKRGNVVGALLTLGSPTTARRKVPKTIQTDKIRKNLAQDVLEIQYGIRPLLKDVQGAAEFLANLLNFPMVQTYKVRKRIDQGLYRGAFGGPAGFKEYEAQGFTTGQLIARLEEVDPVQLVGLTDVASVAWELTPLSFVADWFIPIGGYLAARGLASSLTGTFVTTITNKRACTLAGLPDTFDGTNGTKYGIQPHFTSFDMTVNRTVSTALQVPLPNFKPLSKVASWEHCMNAVALLVSSHGAGGKAAQVGAPQGKFFNWDTVLHN